MASLLRLTVRHLRNLDTVTLSLNPQQNVLYGRNGSGKTSILEAVYMLGAAKSFRTRQMRHVVQRGRQGLRVQARIERPHHAPVSLAVEYENSHTSLEADGVALQRASELAQYLPVLLVNTDSHNLVAGGPLMRRRLLDWGVFHVEHSYGRALSRYQHALKQRNACLQGGPGGPIPEHIWNVELAAHASVIDAARARYVEVWQPWVSHYLQGLLEDLPVSLRYERGWPTEERYADTLERVRADDRQLGYTRYGPHRANIEITVSRAPAEQMVSRGQQKLLILALAFAQAAVLNESRGDRCVVLIDDLAAELDAAHREVALQQLAQLGGQSILAVTEPGLLSVSGLPQAKMFHVEHGTVAEVL